MTIVLTDTISNKDVSNSIDYYGGLLSSSCGKLQPIIKDLLLEVLIREGDNTENAQTNILSIFLVTTFRPIYPSHLICENEQFLS